MSSPIPPRSFPAGEREAIVRCPPCGSPIVRGELVTTCPACGTVHHSECWTRNGGCGTYACAPARRESIPSDIGVMRVTLDDIQRAPARVVYVAEHGAQLSRIAWAAEKDVGRTRSRMCLASFIAALISIPAFGALTGWIAVLLGVIGLVGRRPRERGIGLAVGGVLIGITSALGWSYFLFVNEFGGAIGQQALTFGGADVDPEMLANMPKTIARSMQSNVLITTKSGLGGLTQSIGSGVVVKIDPDNVLILTNRHVVDGKFKGTGQADDPLPDGKCTVKFIGHLPMNGNVVWIAPWGVDAALLRVPLTDTKNIVAACWTEKLETRVSEKVFVVGNPMGLAWSHASGEISQIRRQDFGPLDLRVIQTSAPVNHGNSGGGLYDDNGMLLGINTWTQDKRHAEGLGFAISFHSIMDLIPNEFDLPADQQPQPEEAEAPAAAPGKPGAAAKPTASATPSASASASPSSSGTARAVKP